MCNGTCVYDQDGATCEDKVLHPFMPGGCCDFFNDATVIGECADEYRYQIGKRQGCEQPKG